MGYNKFIRTDGTLLLDLTGDTVTEKILPKGVTAHNAYGDLIVGTGDMISDEDLAEIDTLIGEGV